jgi:hypothetical protein
MFDSFNRDNIDTGLRSVRLQELDDNVYGKRMCDVAS